MTSFYYEENDCIRSFPSLQSLKRALNMAAHLEDAIKNTETVRDRWYSSIGVKQTLQNTLTSSLRATWLTRYGIDECWPTKLFKSPIVHESNYTGHLVHLVKC